MSYKRYICGMETPQQPNQPPRRRGRPQIAAPAGRDLEKELETLAEWLAERPSIKPTTISKEAGLKDATLSNMLRKKRRPQVEPLDKIYSVLTVYGFKKVPETGQK